jgi:hypothetical protein
MRILNKRYWPKSVGITDSNRVAAEEWCNNNLKIADWRQLNNYGSDWRKADCLFYFKLEHDAMLFKLSWA